MTEIGTINEARKSVKALVILRDDGIRFFTKGHGSGYRSLRDGGTLDYIREFFTSYGYDSFIVRDERSPKETQ